MLLRKENFKELMTLVDKPVTVSTTTGKSHRYLVGITDSLSVCISEAKDETEKVSHRVFLNGNVVAQVSSSENLLTSKP